MICDYFFTLLAIISYRVILPSLADSTHHDAARIQPLICSIDDKLKKMAMLAAKASQPAAATSRSATPVSHFPAQAPLKQVCRIIAASINQPPDLFRFSLLYS